MRVRIAQAEARSTRYGNHLAHHPCDDLRPDGQRVSIDAAAPTLVESANSKEHDRDEEIAAG